MFVTEDTNLHIPVLLDAVLTCLQPQPGESYLDLTAGYGGHASSVLAATGQADMAVLVDRDSQAIAELQKAFGTSGVTLMQADFYRASQQLASRGKQFDMILADLGVSSPHLTNAERGFSLQADGPLDMRMDQTQGITAETIVNQWSQTSLAELLKRYGEEPKARQIARQIVQHRPFSSTMQLAAVVAKAWPGHSRVHPATRTFQALRIAVNDELAQLEQSLPLWQQLLAPGGRLAIISFHSLEDRLVKQYLAEQAGQRYDAELRLLTKRPVGATADELVSNPRARSAKLRAAVKIKNNPQKGAKFYADSG